MLAIHRIGAIFAIFMKASSRPPRMARGNARRMSPIEISQPRHTVVSAMIAYCGCRNRLRNGTEFHRATAGDLSSRCEIDSPRLGVANEKLVSAVGTFFRIPLAMYVTFSGYVPPLTGVKTFETVTRTWVPGLSGI